MPSRANSAINSCNSNAEAMSSVLSGDAFDPETIQSVNTGAGLPGEPEGRPADLPRTRSGVETRKILRMGNIPPAQISRVKSILVEYVGPMAGLLVDEKLASGVANLDALVERIAPEIGDARDAQRFREAIERIK